MNPLTNYAEVFNKNDSKLFAELFADDCIFYDTAPTCAGMDPMFVRGKEGVDMIFNMYFHSMPMSAKAGLAQRQCSGLHHLLPRY